MNEDIFLSVIIIGFLLWFVSSIVYFLFVVPKIMKITYVYEERESTDIYVNIRLIDETYVHCKFEARADRYIGNSVRVISGQEVMKMRLANQFLHPLSSEKAIATSRIHSYIIESEHPVTFELEYEVQTAPFHREKRLKKITRKG